jgi:hypothetical protein
MSRKYIDTRANDTGWTSVIQLAESELEQTMKRGRQLRRAIRLLKKNRDDSIKWPKLQNTGQK